MDPFDDFDGSAAEIDAALEQLTDDEELREAEIQDREQLEAEINAAVLTGDTELQEAEIQGDELQVAEIHDNEPQFAPAADAEAAAVRSVRNLCTFWFHYAVLQWALLLASLTPRHRASVVFLIAASKGLLVYGGLLKVFPNSALLRRLLDRRLVATVFVALVLADMVAAGAVANLLTALTAGVPIIVLHTSFRVRDDLEGPSVDVAAENGKEDETAAVVEKKEDGQGPSCMDSPPKPTGQSGTAPGHAASPTK
ncbi:hypothetical protein BAE44_0012744 [Dichanthelium oligosanthes]|uniref:PRA1 family protein n=1 Tax=Dichanthelium oligosanthes TaxID=888268 RepID=A0A1E5VMD5_9POAL|nr:hypothetical protein BAE44_0012744 [Dichanthelium oligosanthes]